MACSLSRLEVPLEIMGARRPASARGAWRIHCFDEVSSTNETVLAAAERGEPSWTVHIARRQSRGRGRAGHSWWSPAGSGLWMSVLLRPRLPPGRLGGLALVAGLAVLEALESLGARGIDLYWPNDLYLGRRKLGGILGEARSSASSDPSAPDPSGPAPSAIALGIGVNIDLAGLETPPSLAGLVASLAETGCPERDPEKVAVHILGSLETLYRLLEEGGSLPELVGTRLAGIGRRVEVRQPPRPPWPGVVLGIGEGGELLVRGEGGEVHPLRAAEVDYDP